MDSSNSAPIPLLESENEPAMIVDAKSQVGHCYQEGRCFPDEGNSPLERQIQETTMKRYVGERITFDQLVRVCEDCSIRDDTELMAFCEVVEENTSVTTLDGVRRHGNPFHLAKSIWERMRPCPPVFLKDDVPCDYLSDRSVCVMTDVPSGNPCAMGCMKPAGTVPADQVFSVLEIAETSVGPMSLARVYGRIEKPRVGWVLLGSPNEFLSSVACRKYEGLAAVVTCAFAWTQSDEVLVTCTSLAGETLTTLTCDAKDSIEILRGKFEVEVMCSPDVFKMVGVEGNLLRNNELVSECAFARRTTT